MNSLRTNYWLHAANVLLLLGYAVSDVLCLRVLVAASCLVSIPYFYFAGREEPLWGPIIWNAVFAAINLIQCRRLFVARRTVKTSAAPQYPERVMHLRNFRGSKKAPHLVMRPGLGFWQTIEQTGHAFETAKGTTQP